MKLMPREVGAPNKGKKRKPLLGIPNGAEDLFADQL